MTAEDPRYISVTVCGLVCMRITCCRINRLLESGSDEAYLHSFARGSSNELLHDNTALHVGTVVSPKRDAMVARTIFMGVSLIPEVWR